MAHLPSTANLCLLGCYQRPDSAAKLELSNRRTFVFCQPLISCNCTIEDCESYDRMLIIMLTTFSNTHHTLHIKHVTHQGPHHLWNCRKIVGDEHQAILRSCTFNELKSWWNGTQSNNNLHRCWVRGHV